MRLSVECLSCFAYGVSFSGMSAQRSLSRPAEGEPSPAPAAKKSRGSNSSNVNGGTPTRASLRRSAGSTLASPDFEYPATRKRSKRS